MYAVSLYYFEDSLDFIDVCASRKFLSSITCCTMSHFRADIEHISDVKFPGKRRLVLYWLSIFRHAKNKH